MSRSPHGLPRGVITGEEDRINYCASKAADVYIGSILRTAEQLQSGATNDRLVAILLRNIPEHIQNLINSSLFHTRPMSQVSQKFTVNLT